MRSLLLLVAICVATALAQDKQAKDKQEKSAPAQTQTFKGVIDQRDSEFVLSTADNFEPIATLRGRGFDKENFARFVGDPVEVKGRLVTENGQKFLYVSAVSDIRRTPAPK
jgi:hypothetical protein